MLYLLYGSDTLRSRRKLREIIEEYRRKTGGTLNLHRFDAEESDPAEAREILETGSIFGAKKLLVIEGALRTGKFKNLKAEALADTGNTTVVFWEREVGASAKKYLEELKRLGAKIQEFRAAPAEVAGDKDIFKLGDVFFTSPREARARLWELLASGHDEGRIFYYLANQARTLLLVKSYLEMRRFVPPGQGLHPFVIKKASAISRGLKREHLEAMLRRFFEEDLRIKTGLTLPRESLFRLLSS